jgi:NADH:ubiquinone oxidoreductase subunit F (NADH-binding)
MSTTDPVRRRPQPRLLAGARHRSLPATLAEHTTCYGRFPELDARALTAGIAESGLLGRGGGSFSSSAKLAAVRAQRGRRVVVGNGVEGEPLSLKDKLLLRTVPHLVLDGLELAATACGARDAILVVSEAAGAEQRAVGMALAERGSAGLDRVGVVLAAAPDRFVLGEETALVAWLSGKAPKPTLAPPRPSERGVMGRPTLVHNVETLAHLALIARFGPGWFRALGSEAEPGSALVTVAGGVHRPSVLEIALGASIRDVVEAAGGATEPIGAFLLGGYFGSWLSADEAYDLPLLDEHLALHGARLGARVLVALPARTCGLAETARVARWLANESAGQCGPCVHGLAAVATAFERLAAGDMRDVPKLDRWLREIEGRGACRHPDGAARFLSSALGVFAHEVELHAGGRCSGGGHAVLRTEAAA